MRCTYGHIISPNAIPYYSFSPEPNDAGLLSTFGINNSPLTKSSLPEYGAQVMSESERSVRQKGERQICRGGLFTVRACVISCGHGGRGIGPFPLAQANARFQYSVTSQLSGLTSWTVSLSRSAMGTIRRQPKTRNPPRMTLRDPSTSPRVLPSPSTISEVEIAEAPPRIGELRAVAAGSVPVLGAPGPGSPPDGDVGVAGP